MVTNKRILALFFIPFSLWGFAYSPWYAPVLELELSPYYAFSGYTQVESSYKNFSKKGYAHIGGVESAFAFNPWSFFLMGSMAQTQDMEYGLDAIQTVLAYQWLDDISGDCITLTSFFSSAFHSPSSFKDLTLFHSGEVEFEWHTALGKEWPVADTWSLRSYFDVGVGVANRGSPYLKFFLFVDKNFCDDHLLSLFATSWVGFGSDPLLTTTKGYGAVKHRNVDVGTKYEFSLGCYGVLGAQVSTGVWSSNYPKLPFHSKIYWSFSVGP